MRVVELLSLYATLVGAFITVIATLEQKLIKRIRNTSAHSKNKSKELSKVHLITKWRLSQLQKSKVIVKTNNGEYLLDEDNYKKLSKKRVIVVVIFMLVSISFILIIHKYIS